jgi:hypothetical protein
MERRTQDERADERKRDNQAMPDELGNNPGQVGPRSAGQSGDPLRLSSLEDAVDESVEELADTDQALEAARVGGVEDAADHPEHPVHTHNEYGARTTSHPNVGPGRADFLRVPSCPS